MNTRPDYVSVIDPISPAIERVKTVLFGPFDLGKWFVIGFSAWLAELGKGGAEVGTAVVAEAAIGQATFQDKFEKDSSKPETASPPTSTGSHRWRFSF